MALLVQKYGGTSVADVHCIKNVAQRVKQTRDMGNDVVVVVSARSGVTNELIGRAKALNPRPDPREMDLLMSVGEQETIALLSIALHALGVPAVSRTGSQAGIMTDDTHTRARIHTISGGDILDKLKEGKVVIVAGFQGGTINGQITTFGRGGSDLTAIALAGALKADSCQILTDVDGVYTADPRIVPNASKIHEINYEEMLELASSGFKVMQSRAVEFAQKYSIPFEVRTSFNQNPGTTVKEDVPMLEGIMVTGVALDRNQTRITIADLPDKPGTAAQIFNILAEGDVIVDMIVQNIGRKGIANISFTVSRDDADRAELAIRKHYKDQKKEDFITLTDIAKLSVVGVGMRSQPGAAARLFQSLADAKINLMMISTSEIKISVAIDPARADEAVRTVHKAFDLGKPA
jgi:aspartate kinase